MFKTLLVYVKRTSSLTNLLCQSYDVVSHFFASSFSVCAKFYSLKVSLSSCIAGQVLSVSLSNLVVDS